MEGRATHFHTYSEKRVEPVCEHFGNCTTSRSKGRKVTRGLKEDLRQEFERHYALPESQEIYKLRKQKVETVYAIKLKAEIKGVGDK